MPRMTDSCLIGRLQVNVGQASSDEQAVTTALKLMERARPTFLFLQLSEPLKAAKAFGWGSGPHRAAVDKAFKQLGQVSCTLTHMCVSLLISGLHALNGETVSYCGCWLLLVVGGWWLVVGCQARSSLQYKATNNSPISFWRCVETQRGLQRIRHTRCQHWKCRCFSLLLVSSKRLFRLCPTCVTLLQQLDELWVRCTSKNQIPRFFFFCVCVCLLNFSPTIHDTDLVLPETWTGQNLGLETTSQTN